MSWNDIAKSSDNQDSQSKKITYAKLASGGKYVGRILDEHPFSRYTHWIPQANEGKGVTVDCPGSSICPICKDIKAKKEAKQTQKYNSRKLHAINWLNRDTNQVELIDKGKRLFARLLDLLKDVGDLRNYDVSIRVSGEGTDTDYTPIPLPQKPLTDAEKALEKYNLNEISLKPTPEQILMLMEGKSLKEVFGEDVATDDEPEADGEAQPDVDFTK